jgi:3-hydroxy-9,10-secoandrosta-1,3,5(10)-triene-9,17-dione monooxygenase
VIVTIKVYDVMPIKPTSANATAPDVEGKAAGAAFLARVDAILPEIRGRATETEKLGRMPDENIHAMTEAGIFRAGQPRQWGGLEVDWAGWVEAVVRVGSACGSTDWITGVVGGHD